MNKHKKILNNQSGSSFIEFMFIFLIFASVIGTLIQTYFIVQAQTYVINTTRYALRQVELSGKYDASIEQDIRNEMGKYSGMTDVQIFVNDNGSYKSIQMRQPIKLKMAVNYKVASIFTIPLSCTFSGTSEKYDKTLDSGNYQFVQ